MDDFGDYNNTYLYFLQKKQKNNGNFCKTKKIDIFTSAVIFAAYPDCLLCIFFVVLHFEVEPM